MKNDEVVKAQKIMTDAEIRQQQIPPFNSEFCLANGINQKIINRFWEKIDFPENLVDSCWNWTAYKNKQGYGKFGFYRTDFAHKFSFMLFKGEITEGLSIRHSCDNPGCVNPYHLIQGTHQENMDDRSDRNRQAKGENNTGGSKLNSNIVKEILYKLIDNIVDSELIEQYNISQQSISLISTSKRWKHIYDLLSDEQKQKIKHNRRKTKPRK